MNNFDEQVHALFLHTLSVPKQRSGCQKPLRCKNPTFAWKTLRSHFNNYFLFKTLLPCHHKQLQIPLFPLWQPAHHKERVFRRYEKNELK